MTLKLSQFGKESTPMPAKPFRGSESRATGPRTPEGRKRAAQNARRHGLTVSRPNDAAIAAQMAEWSACASLAIVPRAALMMLAEARCQVAQVRAYQASLLEHLCNIAGTDVERSDAAEQPAQTDRAALAQQYHLSLRYRAEAEARARKAMQKIATHVSARNSAEET